RLGLRLLGWAGALNAGFSLVEAARPVLDALRDETGESAQLFVRDGDSRLCVAASERPAGLRDTVPIGAVLPVDRGSGGKVLLAWSPDAGRFPGVGADELEAVRRRERAGQPARPSAREAAGRPGAGRRPGVGAARRPRSRVRDSRYARDE